MEIIKKYWLILVIAVLLLIASGMIYKKLHPQTLPTNLVEGTGRMDGDLVNLNAKYAGRLDKIFVDDGVPVTKGMVVGILKSKEFEAQKEELEAQIKVKLIEQDISKTSIPLQLEQAKQQLSAVIASKNALEKNILAQKDVLAQDRRDFKRSQKLYKQKSIDKHDYEMAKLPVDTNSKKLASMKEELKNVQSTVNQAQIGVENATVQQHQLQAIEKSIEALRASKTQVVSMIDEMTLRSSINGVTVEKIANEGEVIGSGMPIATLLDSHSLYLKIFIDTIQNGKIKLGDKAVIFLDAYPNHPIEAEVVRIAQKAEFTPKEVSVRSDRIQRVFAVHLKPLKVKPLLKLGIPAVGIISIDGQGLPSSLDEVPVL